MPLTPPRFFFGAMSPYSWFAAERIEALLPAARWRGVLAGAVFKQHGRTSWGLTERRADGIADCEARAVEHGLGPIHWPRQWPTSDLLVARAMAFCEQPALRAGRAAVPGGASEASGQDLLESFALSAMRLAFLEGADLAELETVLEAGRRTGLAEDELREALADQRVKDALRAGTDEALTLGVFGVPTILVGEELFWGDDRLQDATAAFVSAQDA